MISLLKHTRKNRSSGACCECYKRFSGSINTPANWRLQAPYCLSSPVCTVCLAPIHTRNVGLWSRGTKNRNVVSRTGMPREFLRPFPRISMRDKQTTVYIYNHFITISSTLSTWSRTDHATSMPLGHEAKRPSWRLSLLHVIVSGARVAVAH
jgi:hypothetical protein